MGSLGIVLQHDAHTDGLAGELLRERCKGRLLPFYLKYSFLVTLIMLFDVAPHTLKDIDRKPGYMVRNHMISVIKSGAKTAPPLEPFHGT